MNESTPFLRQYMEIKSQYEDTILFFRMGDFYEMFFEDAQKAAKALDITLTSRGKVGDEPIPMAGVPHHASEQYITRLVDQGFRIAICEQIGDPKTSKGIVARKVVRVVTPGVIVEDGTLDAKSHNFLMGLIRGKNRWGIAYADVSTGDFFIAEPETDDDVRTEIARVEPREMVLPARLETDPTIEAIIAEVGCLPTYLQDAVFDLDTATELLLTHFGVASLEGFGCKAFTAGISAAGAVLHYLQQTRPEGTLRLERLVPYQVHDYLVLDDTTKRNLELLRTIQEGKKSGSLLHLLDKTVTAMGGRTLRRWLIYPLVDVRAIRARQDQVAALHDASKLRSTLRERLQGVADLERLVAKVVAGSAGPRDLASLRQSLEQVPHILGAIRDRGDEALSDFTALDTCRDVAERIAAALVDNPPPTLKEGGVIRPGYNEELDELTTISREGKGYIARLEARERERTGIASLKIKYNKVFGYFIEVTRANLGAVPDDYIRKQTLTTCERFITQDLKEYESKVLGAEEHRITLEHELFAALRDALALEHGRIKVLAAGLARLDALCALAEVAERYRYTRPQVDTSDVIDIVDGRHPVVEQAMRRAQFVPNDIRLDTRAKQVIILTGPNMAGKSTFMRQVALIVIMAQMGSFVPAKRCRVGVVDRVFTRVGASDNLARGQSTFMVEMTETANILAFATRRSLVLLDEIGRGTSTFDGLSIAWAVAEVLHDKIGCKVIFATHYHELIDLSLTRDRVVNLNVSVREWGDQVMFLRKLKEGGASRSYGIQVARLAGLPADVVDRAKEILRNLERGELNELGEPRLAKHHAENARRTGQYSLFARPSAVKEALLKLDVNRLTPLEALSELAALQELARNE